LALSPDDRGGTLRVLVDDLNLAKRILMEHHIPAMIEEVIAVRIPDSLGSLAQILNPILKEYINIEYMFAFGEGDKAVMIFRFSDTDRAAEILTKEGNVVSHIELFGSEEGGADK